MIKFLSILTVAASWAMGESKVLSLNENNYKKETEGKTVFLKMFAPWCGHCKAMAPDWERLSNEWNGHEVGLVAEVDCTDPEAESLCEQFNVEGFPTIVYGDPTAPEEYQGGRDYESLAEFAKKTISKPVCSVSKVEHCDPADRKIIEEILAKSKEDLLALADEVEKKVSVEQQSLDEFIDMINDQYDQRTAEFNKKVDAIKEENNFRWVQQVLQKVHGVAGLTHDDDDEMMMPDHDDDDDLEAEL